MSPRGLVNLERFRQVVPQNSECFAKIVRVYFDDTLERLTLIERAVRSRSPQNVKILAHSALGASRMLGLNGVAAPLQRLEELASGGDLAGAETILRRTRTTLKQTQVYLNQIQNG